MLLKILLKDNNTEYTRFCDHNCPFDLDSLPYEFDEGNSACDCFLSRLLYGEERYSYDVTIITIHDENGTVLYENETWRM